MLTYWYMYLMPFFAAIFPCKLQRTAKLFFLGLFGVTVALFIGLRHEVGKDWFNYLNYYKSFVDVSSFTPTKNLEPGFALVNWVSAEINFGVYGVNLFCGTVFVYGLILFCKSQPYPWVSIGIAMPVLGVIFAMGATRQATSLGIILIAIVSLMKGSRIKYFALLFLAMTFHKSAIVMMPFGIFVGGENKIRHKFIFTVLFLIGIWLVWDKILFYIKYFVMVTEIVEGRLYAYGARARVWMNVIPVLLYILLSKDRTLFKEQGGTFWKYLSIATIISIPLVEFFSAATDRVNLYFSVIQITLWPRIISIQRSKFNKAFVAFIIFVLYSMVLLVWLNFARHRNDYIPYQNIMLLGM